MMKKLIYLVMVLVLTACSTVPLTNRKQITAIPSTQMVSLGAQNYTDVLSQSKLSSNQSYQASVKRVGQRISQAVEAYLKEIGRSELINGYKWEFNVLQNNALNAWCMPGGKIAFYEGIMPVCKDDNGIAVVMSHEIAHAVAKHSNERMTQEMAIQFGGMALSQALSEKKEETQQIAMLAFGVGSQLGVILPYSRSHESEADELGLYFMAMAGYDPHEAPVFWERMMAQGESGTPEFLSTHPDPQNRINRLNHIMPKAVEYYEGKKQ
ncbi:MAG: M48 family metallopeptidase [Draconibacterium sp.]